MSETRKDQRSTAQYSITHQSFRNRIGNRDWLATIDLIYYEMSDSGLRADQIVTGRELLVFQSCALKMLEQ